MRRTDWLAGVSLAILAVAMAPEGAVAQTPASQSEARHYDFDIPAGSLNTALTAFSRITGLQTVAPSATLRGRNAAAVRGSFIPEEALTRLLAGTGLTFRFGGGQSVTLVEAGQRGDGVVLPPLTVVGQGPVGGGSAPLDGYVATNSTGATKTNTPLIETPQAVSVVGRDEMEARATQSVAQALEYTPGVRALSSDPRYDWIQIRGFDPVVYLDNLYLYSSNFGYADLRLEPYGLERVDVVKGPASALYGRGQPGGVVNMTPKRPTETPQGEVLVQGGSFERKQGAFDVSGPIDEEGQFLYRLTGLARDSGTQTDYVDDDRKFIAPAFTWRPDADTSLTLLAQYQEDDTGAAGMFFPSSGTVLPNPHGKIAWNTSLGEPDYDRITRTQYLLGYSFEHRFDETWTFRQNLRYNAGDNETDVVRNHPLISDTSAYVDPDQRILDRVAVRFRQNTATFALDNQAQAEFATGPVGHVGLVGVDYTRTTDEFERGVGQAPDIDVFNPVYGASITTPAISYHTEQTQNIVGVYVQDQLKWDGWIATLSGRYDTSEIETDTVSAGTQATNSDDAFTGRIGLGYLFDNGIAPYASYSTSFYPTIGTSNGEPLKPTTGEQYEVGVKYQPPGFDSFATLSAFELTKQNIVTSSGLDTFQTGEIRVRGLELEGKASLGSGWSLAASYAYQDAEVTDDANPELIGKDPVTVTGMPEHTAALWLDYAVQSGPLSGFGAGAGARYVGATYGDRLNTFEVDSYTLVDAGIRYDLGQLAPKLAGVDVAINATNLLDEEYVANCLTLNECYLGTGRTILGTLRFKW